MAACCGYYFSVPLEVPRYGILGKIRTAYQYPDVIAIMKEITLRVKAHFVGTEHPDFQVLETSQRIESLRIAERQVIGRQNLARNILAE